MPVAEMNYIQFVFFSTGNLCSFFAIYEMVVFYSGLSRSSLTSPPRGQVMSDPLGQGSVDAFCESGRR